MINSSRLIKNSISNIVNGFATSLMSVAITPFLYEILTKDEFSIWSVTIQLGILINVAATSLQVSVGRFVSYRSNSLSKSVNSMFRFQQLAFCLILLSTLFISLLSINYGWLIQNYQAITDTLPNASWSISIVCFSYMLNIFGGYFTGVFIGKEKNEIPALVNVVFKCILGVVLVNVAHYGLLAMSLYFFVINIFSYLVLCYLSPSYIKFIFIRYAKKVISSFPELNNEEWRYYYGVFVLNFSTFLVSGIGVLIISKYDYEHVANYSVAMSLVGLISGAMSTVLSPLIQPLTHLYKTGNENGISKVFKIVTISICIIIPFSVLVSLYIGEFLFDILTNRDNSAEVSSMFSALLLVYLIRSIGVPFGLVLLAKAKHSNIILFPFVEGALCFGFSLLFINVSSVGWLSIVYAVALSALIIMAIYCFFLLRRNVDVNLFFAVITYVVFPLLMIWLFLFNS